MTRYAEGTTVTVENSRGEITGILAKHGVERMAWGTGPEGDRLEFQLGGRHYRFEIAKPTEADVQAMWRKDGKGVYRVTDWGPKVAAEWRRRWRANVLLIKAKLEFAEGGDTTLEREFLPYMIVAGGTTLGDWINTTQGAKLLAAGS
jgi:hypothetical protein